MMFASTTGAGMCLGFPNVCKTPAPPAPPIPIPYPSIAQCPQASDTVDKVMIENKPTIVETSKIPMSSGDEAGVAGGVVSGVNMGPVTYKLGSSKVMFGGKKAAYLTAMTAHNGTNANQPAGKQIVPSQAKVLVAM